MKRVFSLSIILFAVFISTFSQENKSGLKKTSLYAGAQASIAAADLADTHSFGLGVNTQVAHSISPKVSLTGRVSYTYLFGKKYGNSYTSEPGGGNYNYNTSGRYKGMNDFGITAGARYNINDNLAAGGETGICLGSSGGGESESSLMMLFEFLYYLNGGRLTPHEQAIAAFFGLCGDPRIQIGLRYTIRL